MPLTRASVFHLSIIIIVKMQRQTNRDYRAPDGKKYCRTIELLIGG